MAVTRNGLMPAVPAAADGRLTLQISRKWICAEGIAALELSSLDGAQLPAFSAGSHIDLFLPGGLTRQYSLRNDPRERHRYAIGVLRESDGRGGSACVHDRLSVGDVVEASKPRNAFELDEIAPFSLLLAGGIGVTPILAMAYRLSALERDFKFHYCARSDSRLAFRDEIEASPFADKVRFHLDDGPAAQLLNLDSLLGNRPIGAHLYACGPSGFLDAIVSKAKANWPADVVHREYFSSTTAPKMQSDQPFKVKLASTGHSFDVVPGRSIVEVLAENGVDIPVSCEQGICGTCVTRVISGEPDHRDLVLTDRQRTNHITLCCSRALSAELILDL